jgi:hypothetical protein
LTGGLTKTKTLTSSHNEQLNAFCVRKWQRKDHERAGRATVMANGKDLGQTRW